MLKSRQDEIAWLSAEVHAICEQMQYVLLGILHPVKELLQLMVFYFSYFVYNKTEA